MPNTIAHRSVLISSASSIISVLSAYASPLLADVSGATVVENHPSQLNEIVVTSQRRSENLQAIPLSVTAATAIELLNEGVTDTASLSLAVPGLSYTLGGNGATPFIRGVGTTINSVGNEASVATYVDGVYISSINAQLFELANIDRIEVMEGPQSTLFGRNATGAHYTNFKNAPFLSPTLGASDAPVGGNTQSVGDATGFDTVRTPKYTATVSVTYRVPAPRGSLGFVVSDYYNSGFSWDPDDRLRQSSFEVVNASVDWNAPKNGWSVRLGGRNLTGAHYCAYAAGQTLLNSCAPAPPRTYGITLGAHYR